MFSCSAELKDSFKSDIQCFVSELIDNIKERLPDKNTAAFRIFDPLEKEYGDEQTHEIGGHYRIGDSPPITCDDLFTE